MATGYPAGMKSKGGRPPKAKGGLGHVIYVRATEQMVLALDAKADALSAETGLSVSRSDVARKIIAEALGLERRRG